MDKFVSKRRRLDPETSLNKVSYYVFLIIRRSQEFSLGVWMSSPFFPSFPILSLPPPVLLTVYRLGKDMRKMGAYKDVQINGG